MPVRSPEQRIVPLCLKGIQRWIRLKACSAEAYSPTGLSQKNESVNVRREIAEKDMVLQKGWLFKSYQELSYLPGPLGFLHCREAEVPGTTTDSKDNLTGRSKGRAKTSNKTLGNKRSPSNRIDPPASTP